MGTNEKVNKASCYVTLVYNKLVSLDADLKRCYIKSLDKEVHEEALSKSIKYFQNEKRFWFDELKKHLDALEY